MIIRSIYTMTKEKNMIEVLNINKSFNEKKAVDNLSFSIEQGSTFGLLGPNGAGKTTTFRMMTALLKQDSGNIFIDGKKIDRDEDSIKKNFGVVSQHFSLQSEMKVWEILELHGMLHNINKKIRKNKIYNLLKFSDLYADRDKLSKNLSGGMKRKLMLIRAIMHEPNILFLDEPTAGLDPISRRDIWALLKELKKKGLTVVFTTHYIEEAEKLCDEILLMHKGKKIKKGIPKDLIKKVGNYTVETYEKGKLQCYFFKAHKESLDFAEKRQEVNIRKSNLEDVFIKLTDVRLGDKNEI